MIKVTKDLVLQVKEMMERYHDLYDVSAKLGIDYDDVKMIVDIINNVLA